MITRHQWLQRMLRQYKDETGETDVDMHTVARWAQRHGWKMPTAPTPVDLLAREFSRAAREETRKDR